MFSYLSIWIDGKSVVLESSVVFVAREGIFLNWITII